MRGLGLASDQVFETLLFISPAYTRLVTPWARFQSDRDAARDVPPGSVLRDGGLCCIKAFDLAAELLLISFYARMADSKRDHVPAPPLDLQMKWLPGIGFFPGSWAHMHAHSNERNLKGTHRARLGCREEMYCKAHFGKTSDPAESGAGSQG